MDDSVGFDQQTVASGARVSLTAPCPMDDALGCEFG